MVWKILKAYIGVTKAGHSALFMLLKFSLTSHTLIPIIKTAEQIEDEIIENTTIPTYLKELKKR
jgi:hypothetical protein